MTLPNPIDITAFEDAVYDWFSASIEAEVVWAQQSAPRPDYPYGVLNIIAGPIAVGPFEKRTTTDLTRPEGEQIVYNVCVPCTITVSCQVHVNMPDSRNPGFYARALAARAQSRLYLPSAQAGFKVANCAVQRTDGLMNISSIVNDGHVSRAGLDVVFNASLSIGEHTGQYIGDELASVYGLPVAGGYKTYYIQKAQITSDLEPSVDPNLQIDQEFGDV